jgi:dihydroorotase
MKKLIKNGLVINEGKQFIGNILIENDLIIEISEQEIEITNETEIIDASGKLVIPGVIDDQVHFREPGLTHKATIYSESKAAVAGGITSFMEMPNTNPQTTTIELLNEKFEIAKNQSLANFSFYLGATNDNIYELLKVNPKTVCGIKVFMGSSTGNMLVDNLLSLSQIFEKSPILVATHCEDEEIISENTKKFKEKYGEKLPFHFHPLIRSEEACFKSSSFAVELAKKYGTRLHVLHLSTEKELTLFQNDIPSEQKRITAEVCVHHLWFSQEEYDKLGSKIKWNPAVKKESDRDALRKALILNKLDVIATDHAPHTIEEKNNAYFSAPSGGPLVQHALQAMFELEKQGVINLEALVEKMCHAPAKIFQIEKRGFLRKGYKADIVIIDRNESQVIEKENIIYKCGWSPFEGIIFHSKIEKTFVNGHLAFDNGIFYENKKGEMLTFNR